MGNQNNPCRRTNINDGFDFNKPNMIEAIKQRFQHRTTTDFILENESFFKCYHLIAVILSTEDSFSYKLFEYKYKIITQSKIYFFTQQNDTEKNCQSAVYLDSQKGEFYVGSLLNSQKTKKGYLIDKNGNLYDGQFKKNLPSGKGLWKSFYPKVKYFGEWSQGYRDGQGSQQYEDGTVYIGNFFKDKKNGTGTFKFSDGRIFQGQFKDNNMNGYGVLKTKNTQIKGYWKNGKLIESDLSTKHNEDQSRV